MSRIMGFIHDRVAARGHRVDYFCAEDVAPRWQGRLSRFAFPWLAYRHAVRAARVGKPYDIVNIHEPSSAVLASFRRPAGRPMVVVTSHGVERRAWDLAREEGRLGRVGPSLWTRMVYPVTSLWQSSIGLRRADHIFCLNAEDRAYLIHHWSRPPETVTRVFPGAAPVFATAAQGRDYSRFSVVLFAGTWRKNKGIEDLVPAFGMIANEFPDVQLHVLGAGVPDEQVLADFPVAIRSRVHCLRAADETTTAGAFAAADLFVLPSLFEGTPLTLMEAMSSGLPIVTTAVCGMKDVIRDGENGIMVPIRAPADLAAAVRRVRSDVALRTRLGRTARAEALEHYTWDRVAELVVKVYEGMERRVR